MPMLFAIAAGGALGALGRYMLGGIIIRAVGTTFPYATLTVNTLGAVLMGLIVGMLAGRGQASPALQAFLTVGVLGGFTTFSTFSLELVELTDRGAFMLAGLYALSSLTLGVTGLLLGLSMAKIVS